MIRFESLMLPAIYSFCGSAFTTWAAVTRPPLFGSI